MSSYCWECVHVERDKDGITYTVDITQDDRPVRGNYIVSDDADADRADEDEILRRLDSGDVWAWAVVRVTASILAFKGTAHLGGCSYADTADLLSSGSDYVAHMKLEARAALLQDCEACIDRSQAATSILYRLKERT